MSALFNFKPNIKNRDANSILITAPNDIRDKLWNALVQSLNEVVDRTGAGKTQFFVQPYPGYSKRQVYVFTAVFLYSVVTELSLDDFWKLTPDEHLSSLADLLDLPEPVQFDPSTEAPAVGLIGIFEPISKEELVAALTLRISYLAPPVVKKMYKEFQFKGYKTEVVSSWLTSAANAYRRLQFVDPNETFIDSDEWARRVEECARLIQVLEDAYAEISTTNNIIKDLIRSGSDICDLFKSQADLASAGKIALNELLISYSEAKEALRVIESDIDRLCQTFDQKPAKNALKEIKAMTPVEPVS